MHLRLRVVCYAICVISGQVGDQGCRTPRGAPLTTGERDVAALRGWRAEVFGDDALRLCAGKIALAAHKAEVRLIEL